MTLLPTLPGKADGVVGIDPLTLQCARCHRTRTTPAEATSQRGNDNLALILSGSRFHLCPGNPWEGRRLCPACYTEELRRCTDVPHRSAGKPSAQTEWARAREPPP